MAEPLLKRGSTGEAVKQLQQALKGHGFDPEEIDGEFGSNTEAAVKAFQEARGIPADGIVGPVTWLNIDEADLSNPLIKRGSSGNPVRRAQRRLTAAGFDTGGIDGVFGPATESAVRAFQGANGLAADGIVGPQTWAAIDAIGD